MATMIEGDIGRPRSGRPGSLRRPSRLTVLLGLGASAGVVAATAVGVAAPAVVVGGVAAAAGIAVASYREAGRGVVAEGLAPLPDDLTGSVTIDAPRASEVAGHPVDHAVGHSDAA